jgi:hypothetical protein
VALHSDLIGRRVVVRRLLRGESGPSGRPAMTDVLGDLTGWSPDKLTVRRDDGSELTIDQADIVAAKAVPPRPERRDRS